MTETETAPAGLAARVEWACARAGKSRGELAKHLDIAKSAVHAWGKTTNEIASRNLFRAARFLRVEAEWLATGEGPVTPEEAALVRLVEVPPAEVMAAMRQVMALPERARKPLGDFLAALASSS